MLFDGDGNHQKGNQLLHRPVIIQQRGDILALHRSHANARRPAHIDAFLNQRLHHPARGFITCGFSKGAANHGAHAAERRVNQQLAHPRAHEVFFHFHWTHQLQQPLHRRQRFIRHPRHPAQAHGQAVRLRSKAGYAVAFQGGPPGHGTAQRPLRSDHLCHAHFRHAVLQRHDHALLRQLVLQKGAVGRVVQLLGHQEDHIIAILNVSGQHRLHGNGHLHRSGHLRAFFLQRRHLRRVAVAQHNVRAALGQISPQHNPQRTRAVNQCFHLFPPP